MERNQLASADAPDARPHTSAGGRPLQSLELFGFNMDSNAENPLNGNGEPKRIHYKTIGGSQFRATHRPGGTGMCVNCTGLKSSIRSMRDQLKDLRRQLGAANIELETEHNRRLNLENDSGRREAEIAAQRTNFLQEIASLREELENERRLREELGSGGGTLSPLRRVQRFEIGVQADDLGRDAEVTQLRSDVTELHKSYESLSTEYDGVVAEQQRLNDELAAARKKASQVEQMHASLEDDLRDKGAMLATVVANSNIKVQDAEREAAEAAEKLQGEITSARSEIGSLRDELMQLKKQFIERDAHASDLERQLAEAGAQAGSTSSELSDANQKYELALNEIAILKEAVSHHEATANREKETARKSMMQRRSTEKALSEVQVVLQNTRSSESKLMEMIRQLEDKLARQHKEYEELRAAQRSHQQQQHDQRTSEAAWEKKVQDLEQQMLEKDKAIWEAQATAQAKADELYQVERKMRQQQRQQRKALEEALNSVVRLCVVAPTVNVHLGKDTEAYKAPLPSGSVQQFIQGEILPNFARIFRQHEEGKAPDGTPLSEWLKVLLGEMQGTIEEHLGKVFDKDVAGVSV